MNMTEYKIEDLLKGTGVRVDENNGKVILAQAYFAQNGFIAMTKDEFVEKAFNLFTSAFEHFEKFKNVMLHKYLYEQMCALVEDNEKTIKAVTDVADKKYKAEGYKKRFIEKMSKERAISKLLEIKTNFDDAKINRWDFDAKFGSDGSTREFKLDMSTEDGRQTLWNYLGQVYDSICTNPIMFNAKSMMFTYSASKSGYFMNISWPTLSFEFDEVGEAQIKQHKETFWNATREFYSNSTYFGD